MRRLVSVASITLFVVGTASLAVAAPKSAAPSAVRSSQMSRVDDGYQLLETLTKRHCGSCKCKYCGPKDNKYKCDKCKCKGCNDGAVKRPCKKCKCRFCHFKKGKFKCDACSCKKCF